MNKFGILIAGGLFSLSAFAADEGVTLGGYVDAGYSAVMQDKNGTNVVKDNNGFLVREGAVYLGKKWSDWEVFGDFSFMSVPAAPNAAMTLGVSQAYVSNMMENGMHWKLGKFDGMFGYYAGKMDSHAHHLTDMGYIQQAYLPRSHTGWAGGYSFSDMLKLSVVIANDDETFGGPATVANSSGSHHLDAGVVVNADFDMFDADVGVLFLTGEDSGPAKNELGYVASLALNAKLSMVNLGVFGVFAKDDQADSDSDFGIGGVAGFDVNDKAGLDVRAEYVAMGKNSGKTAGVATRKSAFYDQVDHAWVAAGPGVTAVKNVLVGTIGGHWKFNDAVKAKLDYTMIKVGTDGTENIDTASVIQAGVVANF